MNRTDKYWICDECAKKQALEPFKSGNTVIMGLCGWCDSNDKTTLTPMRDFRKPKIISTEPEEARSPTALDFLEAATEVIDSFSSNDPSSSSSDSSTGSWDGGGGGFNGGGASGDW